MLSQRLWFRIIFFVSLTVSPIMGFAHDMTDTARERMASGGYLEVMWTGAEHMLSGYDHLLFLLGVMFFLTRFIDILKFVTAFTVGHTITLIVATYAGITANHYLIDAVIAMTVVYKGFENLDGFKRWLNTSSPNLLLMVFIFGLIHGFGLSARLQQVTLANDPALLGKILLFNVGVEVGQIIALMIMAIAIRAWQQLSVWTNISRISNMGLMMAGGALLVFQLSGYAVDRSERVTALESASFELFVDREFLMGQVRGPDQSPLVDAELIIRIESFNADSATATRVRTDAEGWFVFTGISDQTYLIRLSDNISLSGETLVTLGSTAPSYEHEHEFHIPFYVYIALLLLLSVIPARQLRRRELLGGG
jgi:hypothetical protein